MLPVKGGAFKLDTPLKQTPGARVRGPLKAQVFIFFYAYRPLFAKSLIYIETRILRDREDREVRV
jgi:hypothetical protein